jgi:PII-like signaling protein
LYKDKTSGNLDKNNPLIIEVINFSDWIKYNIKENDNVYLNEMIKQQTIKYINTLRVEWHNTKIPSIREKHEILTKKLNKYMVKKLRHDTYEYDVSLFIG